MQNRYAEIKTERLFLRTLTDADLAMVRDTGITQDDWKNDSDVLNWIRWTNTHHICFMFYIWLAQTNQLIGRVYLHSKKELNHEVELAYGIQEKYRNNGYATEAAKAAIHFAFTQAGLNELVAIVAPDNIPSLRVIEKLNFIHCGMRTVFDNGKDCEFNYFKLCKRAFL